MRIVINVKDATSARKRPTAASPRYTSHPYGSSSQRILARKADLAGRKQRQDFGLALRSRAGVHAHVRYRFDRAIDRSSDEHRHQGDSRRYLRVMDPVVGAACPPAIAGQ